MSRAVVTINTDEDRAKVARWAHQTNIGTVVEFRKKSRSTEQNAKLWAMLTEVSEQVVWYGRRLSPEDWKTIFTASLRKATVLPGIDAGTVVPLGISTSTMTIDEMGNLIELIHAFGSDPDHLVIFKDHEPADEPSPSASSADDAPASSEPAGSSSLPAGSTNSDAEANSASGEPQSSESSPAKSEPHVPGSPDQFRFDPTELTYLKEFVAKALKQASDTTLGKGAKLFDLEGMDAGYRGGVISSDAGIKALDKAIVAIKYVISGDRSRELATNYIARDLLGCAASELEGRRNG